jgi:four helix bundle protein
MRGARDYRELAVWKLADALQNETLRLADQQQWAQDYKLAEETRKTASQIVRNIPEGFRRKSHTDFARLLQYSYSSLGELRALLDEALKKGHVTASDLQPARKLAYRLERAMLSLIKYLRKSDPPPWWF